MDRGDAVKRPEAVRLVLCLMGVVGAISAVVLVPTNVGRVEEAVAVAIFGFGAGWVVGGVW